MNSDIRQSASRLRRVGEHDVFRQANAAAGSAAWQRLDARVKATSQLLGAMGRPTVGVEFVDLGLAGAFGGLSLAAEHPGRRLTGASSWLSLTNERSLEPESLRELRDDRRAKAARCPDHSDLLDRFHKVPRAG
jgi:hypothetical protein